MIELVKGATEPTVIRDRWPTAEEDKALKKAKGWWVWKTKGLRMGSTTLTTVRTFRWYRENDIKPQKETIRAVSHDGAPISLEVEG